MNIDERLEKLVERHEALAQTVDIIAGMQKAGEQRMERLEANVDRLEASVEKLTTLFAPIAAIVLEHEQRLNRLEGK